MSIFRTCINRLIQNSHSTFQTRVLSSVVVSSVRKYCDVPTERANIVKLKGLPFKTTKEEIIEFIGDEDLILDGKDGIYIGRGINHWTNGSALFKLKDDASVPNILKKDGEYLGKRYIDVVLEREDEFERFKYENSISGDVTNMVKVKGVPFKTRKEEIEDFFSGLEISQNGIIFARSDSATRVGIVYVQFTSKSDMKAALQKNEEYMGDRYLHIKEANLEHFLIDTSYFPPNMNTKINSCKVLMRGLPWGVTETDIEKFFEPLVLKAIYIEKFQGRTTGEGEVTFISEADATEALKKHKHNIGHRFIELFSKQD